MVLMSVALAGLSAGVFCSLYLHNRKKQEHRKKIKSRFLGSSANDEARLPFSRLPFVGSALNKRQQERIARHSEAELPRMLDILAMGMQSGLSFDAAFGLYVHRFDTELAQLCRGRFEVWERGLISRSEGLEQLATCIQLPLFDRFCRSASRSLRHGVPLAPLIKEYANQARKEYRNKQKELVLKAPVKMLLPTGVLILPAMMMLVIGPIILGATERMV